LHRLLRDDLEDQGEEAATQVDLAAGNGNSAAGHSAEVEAVLLEPGFRLPHVAPDRRPRDAEALLVGLGSDRIR
jgi:hypothetical protein